MNGNYARVEGVGGNRMKEFHLYMLSNSMFSLHFKN